MLPNEDNFLQLVYVRTMLFDCSFTRTGKYVKNSISKSLLFKILMKLAVVTNKSKKT